MAQTLGSSAEFRAGPRSGAPLPPGPLLGFVVAVAAVIFISLLTYHALRMRSIAAQRVTHTLAVVEELQTILSLGKDAETGQRGFLLTGEETYLQPNANAKAALPAELKKTRELVTGDAEQEQRLASLGQSVNEKLAELDTTIARY
jgi:CHASE3 domain sensor protein